MAFKTCRTCGLTGRLDEFPLDYNKADGHGRQCLKCKRKVSRLRKDYRTARLRSIGMTIEEYNDLYNKQEGICMICNEFNLLLVVDHCHKEMKFRGLICKFCNSGLGFFKDNIKSLEKAIEYLKQLTTK
jgi:hypothetical protein